MTIICNFFGGLVKILLPMHSLRDKILFTGVIPDSAEKSLETTDFNFEAI